MSHQYIVGFLQWLATTASDRVLQFLPFSGVLLRVPLASCIVQPADAVDRRTSPCLSHPAPMPCWEAAVYGRHND